MKSVQPLHESLLQKFTDNTMPNAIVVLFNDNEIKVTSQMISYDLKVGGSVGLLAKVDPVAKKAMVDAGFVSLFGAYQEFKRKYFSFVTHVDLCFVNRFNH
jgi:hypothetical protein